MEYRGEVRTADSVYSIDKVVLQYRLHSSKVGGQTHGQLVLDELAHVAALEYDHWSSRRPASFADQFSVRADGSHTFWVGVGLNGCSGVEPVARLEYNPNKVGDSAPLLWLRALLHSHAKRCEVRRWDLAIDYPVQRSLLRLVKDSRLYEELRKSDEDLTQYVGQRNAPGRVKLYNKALEQGEDGPLTRLELTLDGALMGEAQLLAAWPTVYDLGPRQLRGEPLNDTDRFIYLTLLRDPARLAELGRKKREKMRELLAAAAEPLQPDLMAFREIERRLHALTVQPSGARLPRYAAPWWSEREQRAVDMED